MFKFKIMFMLGMATIGFNANATFPNLSKNFSLANEYSKSFGGESLLVVKDGKILYGDNINTPYKIASGTKSLSCLMYLSAVNNHLLEENESVYNTIKDEKFKTVKIENLINLSSGIEGGKIGQIPSYLMATKKAKMGEEKFQYGPIPYQIFGSLLQDKLFLNRYKGDIKDYMNSSIFSPLGIRNYELEESGGGSYNLASGLHFSAFDWAKIGVMIVNDGNFNGKQLFKEGQLNRCFIGSEKNASFGMGFWLNNEGIQPAGFKNYEPFNTIKNMPSNLIMSIGSGNQVMYVFPTEKIVIVRQAKINLRTLKNDYSHETFLNYIFK